MCFNCKESTTSPTLILSNGKIWTGTDADKFVEVIAVTGNTITQIGDTEPIHADPAMIAVWGKAIGPVRLLYSFAWNSMLNQGAELVFSNDWPAEISINPIRGIHVAVNRRDLKGFPEEGWVPSEKITLAQALKAYTYGGAYSSFEEDKKGLIQPGFLADVIVFSEDLFEIEPMRTHEVKVVMTIVDGKVVYELD